MPVLRNARHERFAREVARGSSLKDAYKLAGFKPNRANATHLRRRPEVDARIQQLLTIAAEKTGITRERVLEELARIGFSNITDVVSFSGRQVTLTDSTGLPPDVTAAIAEVRKTKDGIVVKFHDKRAALVDLGRHLNLFRADPEGVAGELTLAELVAASYEAGEKRGNAKQIEGTVIEAEKAGGDPGAS